MRSSVRCAVLPNAGVRTHLLLAFLFTIATAVSAQISFRLWFSPVPVTLQVMTVILSGLVLGSRWGAISQIQYLAMGAMGLPVFAEFKAGPAALAGPTGGYLLGFVLSAFVAGWIFERLNGRKIASWCGGVAGMAAIYLFGASWLAVWMSAVTRQPVSACIHNAWVLGVVPFIGVDLLKAIAASAIAHRRTANS
jgi:biotin transport system substrate-specific component